MLFAFDPRSDDTPDIHWTEILTIITVTTMLFEEVRQVSAFYFTLNSRHKAFCFFAFPVFLSRKSIYSGQVFQLF